MTQREAVYSDVAVVPVGMAYGTITCEHPSSWQGQPVMVVAGVAYGPSDHITAQAGPEEEGDYLARECVAKALADDCIIPARRRPTPTTRVTVTSDLFDGAVETLTYTEAEEAEWAAVQQAARALALRFVGQPLN